MDILIYRWNAWNQADIEETFTLLGYHCNILTQKPDSIEEDPAFVDALAIQLKQTRPRFLFSINFFPVLADACHIAACPYVCWNCDGSLLAMYHETVFYDSNFIFTFDRECVTRFRQMGVSHIWHMPLAVNERRIKHLFSQHNNAGGGHTSGTDSAFRAQHFDISFVGSLYAQNSFDEIADRLPDYLSGYLDGILAAQQLISGGTLLESMLTPFICQQLEELTDYHRSSRSFAEIRQLFSTTVLGFKSANLERTDILQSLALEAGSWDPSASLHLFTSEPDVHLPLVRVHPPVDYFTEMPWIFHNSTINLNSTVPTIYTGIPLRVWDILACGGFLLTDYRGELTDYFEPDKHLCFYEDTEELLAKAEYYYRHQEAAQAIAAAAQNFVLQEHTLTNRLQSLLQIFHSETS